MTRVEWIKIRNFNRGIVVPSQWNVVLFHAGGVWPQVIPAGNIRNQVQLFERNGL